MASESTDRVRVARVEVQRGGGAHEIPNCWISVQPDAAELRIWLSREEELPLLTVPLDQAVIEWEEIDVPLSM